MATTAERPRRSQNVLIKSRRPVGQLRRLGLVVLVVLAAISSGRPAHAQERVLVVSVEGITEYRLANGLRVILMPDASSPRITVVITYFVGVRHEGSGETGMAHLLEHMLLKGTADHPDVAREMSERGGAYDASTWYDRTNYYETFTAGNDNVSWALGLEADRMLNARLEEEELRSERTVVLNELDYYKGLPLGSIRGRVQATAYHWHNYGKSVGGERSDLENVPIERLRGFYRRYYQPDNAALLVTGRFDEGRALELVQEKFGSIPRPVRTGDLQLWSTYTREPPQEGEREINLRRAGDQQIIVALHHIPPASHPDFAAVDLLAYILGNAPSGRLYRNLVATGLAAEVAAQAFHFRDPAPLLAHATVPPDGDLAAAEQALKQTLSAIVSEEPVTGDEVERARKARLRQMQREFNDTEAFARSLSQWLAVGDWRLFFLHRDRIEQATAADVNRVARAYLKPANRTLGRLIPTPIADRTEIPSAPDVQTLVHPYQGRQVVASGKVFDPSPGNVDARTSVFTLPNGFTVALLPKSTRGRTVQGSLRLSLGDEQSLWGRAIAGMLTRGMLMSGTERISRQELRDTLDELHADVRVEPGLPPASDGWFDPAWFIRPPARVTSTIEATAETLADVVRLVAELVRSPGFAAHEFEILKQQQLASLQSRRSEPMQRAGVTLARHMEPRPVGHPHYRYTLDEAVVATEAMTLNEVKAFHRDFYGPQKGNLVLIGDFDPLEVRAAVEEAFGGWQSPRPYTRIPAEAANVPAARLVIEARDQANAYFFAWQNLRLRESDPDYPALVLAAWMLGRGELSSRLGRRLRVKEGLSYALLARLAAHPVHPDGHFAFIAMHAPGNADRVEAAFRDEIRKALEEGFKVDELEAAKQEWLEARQLSRSEDRVLADLISSNLYFDREMAWHAELEQRVRALTLARVNAAARAHLNIGRMTIVAASEF